MGREGLLLFIWSILCPEANSKVKRESVGIERYFPEEILVSVDFALMGDPFGLSFVRPDGPSRLTV
jgi:hypothetical protein